MEIVIRLNKLQFHAPIGWYEEEQLNGSDIVIETELKIEVEEVNADELSHTVNYESVYDLIERITMKPTKLLETVGNGIASEILALFKQVTEVKVIVAKLHPPLRGKAESVSAEVVKKK